MTRSIHNDDSIELVWQTSSSHETDAISKQCDPEQTTVELKSRSKLQLSATLVALYLSLFVAALDQTIVATAIPTISADLHSASGYTWVGGAYLLANAAAGPIWAKLSDIWGRKPILLIGVAWFFFSSMFCALAVNMKMLIAGRALQGVAGAALLQLVTITISDLFSMRSRTLYLGFLEFMWAFAGGVGPILGGVFTELVTWRWNFWVNLPVSGLTFVLLFVFLDIHNPKTKAVDGLKAIDWLGSLSILGLTLMLLLGLDFGGAIFPWSSPKVICLIVFGALMSVFFFISEKKFAKYPLIPLGLFNLPSNVACLLVTYAQGFVFISGEYYLPLYFQAVRSASPIYSGLYVIPLTISEAVAGIVVGILIHRTGRYLEIIWVGLVLLTLGTGLYINIDASSSLGKVIAFELVAGVGAGCLFEPPLIALQALVAQDDIATATATLGFVRNLATSMSIVIAGVVIQNSMDNQASNLRAAGLPASLIAEFTGADAAANVNNIVGIADAGQRLAVKKAFAESLRNVWILNTVMSAVGLVIGFLIARSVLSREHTETRTGLREKEKQVLTEVVRPENEGIKR